MYPQIEHLRIAPQKSELNAFRLEDAENQLTFLQMVKMVTHTMISGIHYQLFSGYYTRVYFYNLKLLFSGTGMSAHERLLYI